MSISFNQALIEELAADYSRKLERGDFETVSIEDGDTSPFADWHASGEARAHDPLGEAETFLTAMATNPAGLTSVLAEALRATGMMDVPSVIEGVSTRPELDEIPGTQEWALAETGHDPYSSEAMLGYLFDADNLAMLGPALRSLLKETGGLPESMKWLEDTPRYIAELDGPVKESWRSETADLTLTPVVPDHWKSVTRRGVYRMHPDYDPEWDRERVFYDPRHAKAELKTDIYDDEGMPFIYRNDIVPTAEVSSRLRVDDSDDMLWRGMRWEEMQNIKDSGRIESNQSMNLSPQVEEGSTSFGTRPEQSEIYATSFAHARDRPSAYRPGYVIGVNRANVEDMPELSTMTPGEVNARPVDAEHIEQIYRAEPYAISTSKRSLYRDALSGMKWKEHGAFPPSIQYGWRGDLPSEQAAMIDELRDVINILKRDGKPIPKGEDEAIARLLKEIKDGN